MIEKSSTRMPSSGAVIFSSACIPNLLSRKPEATLRNEAALNFVGADGDDPHQRMAQVLLEPPVVERTRHAFRKRGAHAEDIERRFAEALHQFAGKHLADCAIFRRRDAVRGKLRALHHQEASDLDLGREHSYPVADDRILRKRRRVALSGHHMRPQLLEGMRDLEHNAAADKAALEGERGGQHLPTAIDLADDVFEWNADFIVEDIGE